MYDYVRIIDLGNIQAALDHEQRSGAGLKQIIPVNGKMLLLFEKGTDTEKKTDAEKETQTNEYRMLGVSIRHLTEATVSLLEKNADNIPMAYQKRLGYDVYGYFVHVPEDMEEYPDTPSDLKDVIRYASKRNYDWVMFDTDEEIIRELAVY